VTANSSCFLHVPKSGGSTLLAALGASLNGGVFHAHERAQHGVPLEYLLARYPVVAGHFTFAQLSPAILERSFVFTVLREPVDRAVSLYYYYRAQPTAAGLDPRVPSAKAVDLATFVERLPGRVSPWSNWQTFVFSGARHCERPAHELLPEAMDNLRRMTLVGVSDDLGAVIRRIGQLRGWPLQPPAARINVTPHRVPLEQIAPATVRRLAELNDCDRQLVASARELWEQAKAVEPAPVDDGGLGLPAPRRPSPSEHGTREIVITGIHISAGGRSGPNEVYLGERFGLRISGYSSVMASDVTIGIRIDDHLGIEAYGVNTRLLGLGISLIAGQTFDVDFSLAAHLAPGIYHVTAAVHAGTDHLDRCYHWIDNVTTFQCRSRSPLAFSGVCDLRATAGLSSFSEQPVAARCGR
jgi:hypothetical protein